MEDSLINFETAKLAKEKGFNKLCYAWFYIFLKGSVKLKKHYKIADIILEEDEVHELIGGQHGKTINEKYSNSEDQPHILARPTQSLLQRWLREVHKINVESNYLPNIQKYRCLYKPMILIPKEELRKNGVISLHNEMKKYYNNLNYNTYEEALEIGLQEALKLVKNNK